MSTGCPALLQFPVLTFKMTNYFLSLGHSGTDCCTTALWTGREGSEICSPDVIEYCCTLLAWYISNTRIIYISLHCSPRIVFVKVLWNFLNLNNEGKGRVGRGRGKGAADASKIAFRGMWGIHSSEELKWTPAPSPLSQPPTKRFSF